MTEFFNNYSKYGVNVLFVCAIIYLNTKLNKQEAKLERVEFRLYDCLQTAEIQQLNNKHEENNPIRLEAILESRKRYLDGKWQVFS